MNSIKRLAIITVFAILATACSNQGSINRSGSTASVPKNASQSIRNLLAQAQNAPELKAAQLKLQASKLMLLQTKYDDVITLLNNITLTTLPDSLKFKIILVKAKAAIGLNDSTSALHYLSALPQDTGFSSAQLKDKYLILASAYGLMNQLDKEVVALISASEHVRVTDELTLLNENIWQVFKTVDLAALKQLSEQPNNSYALRGWLALIIGFKEQPNSQKIVSNEWYKKWRAHSAARNQPLELAKFLSKEPLRNTDYDLNHVVVALPLSGRYAKGASAVLKGIRLAASKTNNNHIKVTYIDSAVHNSATAILEKAQLANADAIIGPIDRNLVSQFAQMNDLPLPVLALNNAAISNSNLYQFGLANEDEVRGAAVRAFNDGRRSVLVLVPEGEKGDIAANTFMNEFNSLGGDVADITYYNASKGNITSSIAKMLRLNQGSIRGLQKKVKTAYLSGAIRRMTRKDADAIFLFSTISDAYQIGPSLHYFYANNIPLYATSKIYRGKPNPTKDIDLNGMMFGDLPWVLAPTNNKASLSSAGNTYSRIGRLYALGIDAFNVSPKLFNLSIQPQSSHSGETGNLAVSADNVLQKTLTWAKFVNGRPQVLPSQ